MFWFRKKKYSVDDVFFAVRKFHIFTMNAIDSLGEKIMADTHATADDLKNDLTAIRAGMDAMNQAIVDLRAQVAAGSPATVAQFDDLHAQAQSIIAAQQADLTPPATTPAPTV